MGAEHDSADAEDGDQTERIPSHRAPDPWRGQPGLSITESPSGTRVISAGAALDAAAAAELRRETYALLARSTSPLVIDLSDVRDLDAEAACAVLLHVAHEAGDADVDLRVVRDSGAHDLTRAAVGDESWFEVYPTLDAALGLQHRRP